MSTPSQYNFPDTTVSENFSRVIYFVENPATDRLFIPVNAPADQGGIEYGGAGTSTSGLVGGTGYSTATGTATTGGTGNGLTVTTTVTTGVVQTITIVSGGSGYTDGDTITVSGGNGDCTFTLGVTAASTASENTAMQRAQSQIMTGYDAASGLPWGRTELGSNATGIKEVTISQVSGGTVQATAKVFSVSFDVNPPGTATGTITRTWVANGAGLTNNAGSAVAGQAAQRSFTPSAPGVMTIECTVASDQAGVVSNVGFTSLTVTAT